jgi:hypothetical protein
MEPITDRLVEFFSFVEERFSIYVQKEILGLEKPWTSDETLTRYRFCNVHRHTDNVSQLMIGKVVSSDMSLDEKILNIVLGRFFNTRDMYDWFPITKDYLVDNIGGLEKLLDERKASGVKLWSDAYLIGPRWYTEYRKRDKHVQVLHIVRDLVMDTEIMGQIKHKIANFEGGIKDGNKLHKWLTKSIYLAGPFLAGQILADLSYLGESSVTTNDYVIAGPGTLKSLNYLFGVEKMKQSEYNTAIQAIHSMQEEFLTVRWGDLVGKAVAGGFSTPYNPERPDLISLMDIQSCFCEFRKYLNLKMADDPSNGFRCKKRYFR